MKLELLIGKGLSNRMEKDEVLANSLGLQEATQFAMRLFHLGLTGAVQFHVDWHGVQLGAGAPWSRKGRDSLAEYFLPFKKAYERFLGSFAKAKLMRVFINLVASKDVKDRDILVIVTIYDVTRPTKTAKPIEYIALVFDGKTGDTRKM